MKIHSFTAIRPNLDLIPSPESFFKTIKHKFPEHRKSDFFSREEHPSLYLYEIEQGVQNYYGLLACIDIDTYRNGKIKIHENTLPYKEQDSMERILERKAMIKPILLTHEKDGGLLDIYREYCTAFTPLYEVNFEEKRQKHAIYNLNHGKYSERIVEIFERRIPHTYVADGHHRTTVMEKLDTLSKGNKKSLKFDKLFCAFFSFEQMDLGEFNRVVQLQDMLSPTMLIAAISRKCNIVPLDRLEKPNKKHEMHLYINEEWYKISWKERVLDKYKSTQPVLDTNLLNKEILRDVIGIEDVRTDERLKFVKRKKGIDGVLKHCKSSKQSLAFLLHPLDMSEFKQVSDAGLLLPPKSTYFEPRMKNGIITHSLV